MAAQGKVPILEGARAGYTFMRASLRQVAPAAAMFAGITALAGALAPAPGAQPDPSAAMLGFIATALTILFGFAYSAFVYRLALRNDASGFYGLKLGKDESNLLGAGIVVGFFFLIVLLLGIVVFSIAMVPAASQAGVDLSSLTPGDEAAMRETFGAIFAGPGGMWLIVLGLAMVVGLIWLSVRLFLVNVATIGEGRIMAFSTWSWTKGDALRIFAAAMVVTLPIMIPIVVVVALLSSMLGTSFVGLLVADFVQAFGQNLILFPAVSGLSVFLYRGLRPPDGAEKQIQTG